RGAQLEALRRRGLRIESPMGDLQLDGVAVSADPAAAGTVELVLFLVKLYDTEAATAAMAPLIGPQTAIVSFQNGIDAWERIGAIAGSGRVMGGVARITATLREPGIVRHTAGFALLRFGERTGAPSDRCYAIERVLDVSGLDARAVPDIDAQIW